MQAGKGGKEKKKTEMAKRLEESRKTAHREGRGRKEDWMLQVPGPLAEAAGCRPALLGVRAPIRHCTTQGPKATL